MTGKVLFGIIAATAALGGLAYKNYRNYMPHITPLSKTVYPIETQKLAVRVNGRKIYAELLRPKGAEEKLPTVICSHGFGSSYRFIKQIIGRPLARSGYAAVVFDFCGGSNWSRSDLTMNDMSILTEKEDLLAVIDCVKTLPGTDPAKLYLFGESQGGMVSALAASSRRDEIRAMVLYYPAFCIPDDARRNFPDKAEIPEHPKVFSLPVSGKYVRDAWDIDVWSEIKAFDRPVLIIHGDSDEVVDVEYGRKGAQVYENAQYVELKGENHGFSGNGKKRAYEHAWQFLEADSCA